mmetsp:Transcript_26172/g.53606  ORF Transcript_26172/g.53606 Transcript_26172/m.53606 type:complete len:204 (-) Transcript_26172:96-707(-)
MAKTLYAMAQTKLRRMRRNTTRLRCIATTTSWRDDRTRTMSAASTATSVPAPMATPTSARARATESLMPSPTTATPPGLLLLFPSLPACPSPRLSLEPVPPPKPPPESTNTGRSWRRCSLVTRSALPSGVTPAQTLPSSIPTSLATARAVTSLSPVHIQTSTPMRCSALTVDLASAWMESAMPRTPMTRRRARRKSEEAPSKG